MMEFEQHPTEPNTLVIKMRKRYIAKHSDEDLQAAVLAEREACAKLIEGIEIRKTTYSGWLLKVKKGYADAIRAREEK